MTTQGQSTWEYRSVDVAGNTEMPQTLDVKLDSQAPATAAFAAKARTRKAVTLKYQVNDASPGCGSATAVIRIYKGKKLKKTLEAGRLHDQPEDVVPVEVHAPGRPLHAQGLGDRRRREPAEPDREREAHRQVRRIRPPVGPSPERRGKEAYDAQSAVRGG